MRDEVQRLLNILDKAAIEEDAFAEELVELAFRYERNAQSLHTAGMRNLSPHHRIRGIHAHAQIARLSEQYGRLLRDEP